MAQSFHARKNFVFFAGRVPSPAGVLTSVAGYPARDIANLLFLSLLTLCVLFMPLNAHLHLRPYDTPDTSSMSENTVASVAPIPVALLKQAVEKVSPPEVSTIEQEVAMAPRSLMKRWDPIIAEVSRKVGISESWIRAVIRMESGGRTMKGNRPIRSGAGAMGLMQLMPGTYAEMRARYGLGKNAYDPRDNILAGAAYLRILYKKYGYPAMFAAYNTGPGNLENHLYRGRSLPAETRNYVKGVTGFLGDGSAGAKSAQPGPGNSVTAEQTPSNVTTDRIGQTFGP